jgi:hypothetical protein
MALQAMAEEGRGQVGLGVELDGAGISHVVSGTPGSQSARPAIHPCGGTGRPPARSRAFEVGEDRGDLIRQRARWERANWGSAVTSPPSKDAAGGRRQLTRDERRTCSCPRHWGRSRIGSPACLEVDGIDGDEPSAPRELLGAQQMVISASLIGENG